jgi:hypothetical protein
LLDSDVGCVIFPNSGDSSATPASSSIAVVHLWPKVSTPSRSPRRSRSVLPFPCTFGGRPHRISISHRFSVLLQSPWPSCSPPSLPPPSPAISATPCRRWGSPRIPLHLLPQFCTFAPRPSPRPPPPTVTRTTGAPVRLPFAPDKVVFRLGPYSSL